MFSLSAIRIENLRSLVDTGFISLKPITVLVGKNSAGKSTFARFIPLLKQSIQERKRAPVLWFGRLVDFGSFSEALSRNRVEDEIRFTFRLSFSVDPSSVRRRRLPRRSTLNLIGSGHIDITLALRNGKNGTYPDRIVINAFGREYQVVINESNLIESFKWPSGEWKLREDIQGWAHADKLFPQILLLKKHGSESHFQEYSYFWSQLEDAVRVFVHGNTTNATIAGIAERVPIGQPADVLAHIRNLPAPASWSDGLRACTVSSKRFERVYDAAFLHQLPQLLEEINVSLENEISKSSYLEPIRATAQRYYRQQELAVEEIDSKGANIAMFLEGLPEYRKKAFSVWLREALGFSVSSIKDGGTYH
jgi:hypothetical protein